MSQYFPLITWRLDVGGLGFNIQFETSPGVWTTQTGTAGTHSGLTNDASGNFYYAAGTQRYAAKFDAAQDLFYSIQFALTNRLVSTSRATGVTFSEIETYTDTFLRGGMPARRLRIDIQGATGFTRFRIRVPGGAATGSIIPALGGIMGETYTSDTNFRLVLPYAYDGAFFLPSFHTHDLRVTPMAIATSRTIQEMQSSVVVRRKSATINLNWKAVPAALVKNDGRYWPDSRARAGVAELEAYACFENFWHACVLGSKEALIFRDASPGELDCNNCVDRVYADFGSEDNFDMGNLLTEMHMEMGFESYDISVTGKVRSGSRLRLT